MFDYLAAKETFEEDEAVVFMRQLLDGLAFLHRRSVVHLDVKVCGCGLPSLWYTFSRCLGFQPENILLKEETSVSSIKLIDFGLARKLDPEKPEREVCGTPEFVGKLINQILRVFPHTGGQSQQ